MERKWQTIFWGRARAARAAPLDCPRGRSVLPGKVRVKNANLGYAVRASPLPGAGGVGGWHSTPVWGVGGGAGLPPFAVLRRGLERVSFPTPCAGGTRGIAFWA